jgi:DNA-binding NarL/FixJ family response regulator
MMTIEVSTRYKTRLSSYLLGKPVERQLAKAKVCYNLAMTETGKIRILIADDFKVLRDVIRLHLERAGDMGVVGEAPDLNEALDRTKMLQPDVIVMNYDLPPLDSAYAAALFREQGINAAILAISMKIASDLIHHSFRNGVNGFMHKDEIDEFLVDAIRSVHRGERYLSPKAQEAYGSIQE